jgi:hypothetical protein
VLPELLERGEGAILVGHGSSAVEAMPGLSGVGPVMAATRNYLYGLNAELAGTCVYVGTIAVGAMIIRSAAHSALTSGAMQIELPDGMELPLVDPDELAAIL